MCTARRALRVRGRHASGAARPSLDIRVEARRMADIYVLDHTPGTARGRGNPHVSAAQRTTRSRTNLAETAGVQRITRHRFAGLRAHVVSKLSALTFVVLILLPFTAPFRSFDLAQSSSHASDALPKDVKDKAGPEGAIVPATWSLLSPVLTAAVAQPQPQSHPLDSLPFRHVALRI
jgi:hypothetical protein